MVQSWRHRGVITRPHSMASFVQQFDLSLEARCKRRQVPYVAVMSKVQCCKCSIARSFDHASLTLPASLDVGIGDVS